MSYKELKQFGQRILIQAKHHHHPFEVYMYSPTLKEFIKVDQIGNMNDQTKYIITFNGNAVDEMSVVIEAFAPSGYKAEIKKGKDNLQVDRQYGFDVYQGVSQVDVFISPSQSSLKLTSVTLEAEGRRLLAAQEAVFKEQEPRITEEQLKVKMSEVKRGFREVMTYLNNQGDQTATVHIKRLSGIAHKFKVDPNTGTKRVTYRNLVIAFATFKTKFPKVILPKPLKPRKKRSDSISEQYKESPSSFKFYSQFGIFEVHAR